jgi:RNA polymerase sigma factor (sigma-70 family)
MPKLNELSKSVIDYQASGSEESFLRILKGVSQWLNTETRKTHHILSKDGCYSVEESDCKQEIILVLMKAISRYDHRSGANFFTVLHNHHATATVVSRKRKLHQFSASRAAVEAGLDLATLSPVEQLKACHDHGKPLKDMLEISEDYLKLIDCMKSCLSDREFDILRSRAFGEKLEEIGDRYSLTRERIRQIEKKAIAKLHEAHSEFSYVEKDKPVVCDPVIEALEWLSVSRVVRDAVNSTKAREALVDWLVSTQLTGGYSASA